MSITRLASIRSGAAVSFSFFVGFVVAMALSGAAFAPVNPDGGDTRDRIATQEKLLYAYAYTYDSKDCASWSKLFILGALFDNGREK